MTLIKFYEKSKHITDRHGDNISLDYSNSQKIKQHKMVNYIHPEKCQEKDELLLNIVKSKKKQMIDSKSKSIDSKLKEENASQGNNSLDEFLLLVNKTKRKYKNLLEKGYGKPSNIEEELNCRNHTLRLRKLKTQSNYMKKRYDELCTEMVDIENKLRNIHLMSFDQLQKLQNLDYKQGLLEDKNIQMITDSEEMTKKKISIVHHIEILEESVSKLQNEHQRLLETIANMNLILSSRFQPEREELENICSDKIQQINNLRSEINQLQSSNSKMENVIHQTLEANKYKDEISRLHSKITKLEDEIRTSYEKKSIAENLNKKIEADLQRKKLENESSFVNLKKSLQNTTEQIKILEEQKESLELNKNKIHSKLGIIYSWVNTVRYGVILKLFKIIINPHHNC